MNQEELVNAAHRAGVRLIRFLYCDNGGVIRGKVAHIDALEKRLVSGIGLTTAMQAMNLLDQLQPVEGFGPVGEIRLVPDQGSFVLLPYAPHSAAMMCDMLTLERQPWGACPRTFLQRMIARAAEQGITAGDGTLQPMLDVGKDSEDLAYVYVQDASGTVVAHTFGAAFPEALKASVAAMARQMLAEPGPQGAKPHASTSRK